VSKKRKSDEVLGCIYLLTNSLNGKKYVGQYKNVEFVARRWKRHIDVALDTDDKRPLYRAIRKAWKCDSCLKSFTAEVIWRGPVERLDAKEIHYIAKLHTWIGDPLGDRSYNLTKGGDGVRGLIWSKSARKNLIVARRIQFENPAVRKTMSFAQLLRYKDPAERAKQGAATRLARKNPAVRKRLSEAQILRYKNPAARKKTGAAARRAYSDDPMLRKRMSAAQLRRYQDQAEHEKQSAGTKRRYARMTAEECKAYWRQIHPNGHANGTGKFKLRPVE